MLYSDKVRKEIGLNQIIIKVLLQLRIFILTWML